jgi:hypothetical protein
MDNRSRLKGVLHYISLPFVRRSSVERTTVKKAKVASQEVSLSTVCLARIEGQIKSPLINR